MELIQRVVSLIKESKKKVENGGINCVPLNFRRFSHEVPGVEQKNYYQVTAYTKVGKSQITDKMFMYDPLFFAMEHPDLLRIKIFYFTLEMSKEQKMIQMISHLLWRKYRIRKSPKELRSVQSNSPLSEETLNLIESEGFQKTMEFFESRVEFIDDIKNPTGIYKFIRAYAQSNGTQHTREINITNKETGESKIITVDDYYEPRDKDEYVIIIIDHMALLSPENSYNLRETMVKMSEYLIQLRNKYRYIPVAVIQQSMDQESNDNFKLGRLRPSINSYGDAKTIARDADYILGLFSPFKYGLETYEQYNIRKFGDHIRFLELIAGREGGGGSLCPLFFDGATNTFEELPLPTEQGELERVYQFIKELREPVKNNTLMFLHKIKTLLKSI